MSRATEERDDATQNDGEAPFAAGAADATDAVAAARRGFKRDVTALVAALRSARLFVPLAKRIANVRVGTEQEVGEELSLSPHLLFDDARMGYVAAFTRPELVAQATEKVGWTTDDGPLEYCALPGPVVLDLATALIDDERVRGLLLNPMHDTELLLQRHEVASLAQGRALPLVGYVAEIPLDLHETRLEAEMEGGPPADVVRAIEGVLEGTPGSSFSLTRTFNPERDLEPHLTLTVSGEAATENRAALAEKLAAALDGALPPPGYIDILFG